MLQFSYKGKIMQLNQTKYSFTIINEMFWQLFPAQFLSNATSCLSNVINGLIVGNFLAPEALVALGFVSPLTIILGAIASIVSAGARIISGRYMGRSQLDKIKNVYTEAIISLFVIGALFTLIVFMFSNPIALLLGAKEETTALTSIYIKGLAIGIIPTLINPSLMIFLQMNNKSNKSFISVIILAIANLIFSLLNVKVFDGGVFGMGLSTTLSQFVTMAYLYICILKDNELFKFDIKLFNISETKQLIILGSPSALASILYSIRNIVFNTKALDLAGTDAVSALAVMNSTAGVFDAVNIAVGAVSTALASLFVGEEDNDSLVTLFKVIIKNGLILAFIKIIIIVLCGKSLVVLFGAKGNVISMAYELYIFYGICMPINIITLAFMSQLQSLNKVKFSNILYIFNAIVFPLGCCYLLGSIINIRAIWIAYAVAEILTILVIFIKALIKYKKPTIKIDELLMYEKNKDNVNLSISVETLDEVVLVAKAVEEFLKENKIDASRSKKTALCLEEIAGNIVEHGFTKAKKNKCKIDIHILIKEDELYLRVRDNAPKFNPKDRLDLNSEDPCKNIGIRMVNKLAKEMNYQNSFSMNILNIKI